MLTKHQQQFIKGCESVTSSRSRWDVFKDWLALASLSLMNSCAYKHDEVWEKREAEYLRVIRSYGPEVVPGQTPMDSPLREKMNRICELSKHMAEATADDPFVDFLGPVYEELGSNKGAGQFFTPQPVAALMAKIGLVDKIGELITEKGYITMAEPCSGAAVMILEFAREVEAQGFLPKHIRVDATDIDPLCYQMTYMALSLANIPARVRHGDSLSGEVWDEAITPAMVGIAMGMNLVWREPEEGQQTTQQPEPPVRTGQLDLFGALP